jgi:hypothetical protein
MAEIVADGTVDVAGLARPLVVEPDLPRRILAGKAEGALPVAVTLRNRTLDSMLATFWHIEQIHLLAAGQDPDVKRSRIGALLRGLAGPLGSRFGR